MIVKHLRWLAVYCVTSLVILVIIPRDPKNMRFFGFSSSRLAMIAGFLLLLGFFLGAAAWLQRRPELQARLAGGLEQLNRRRFLRAAILFCAGLVLALGFFFLSEWLLTTDDHRKQILLRLIPLIFFLMACAWETLNLEIWQEERRRWLAVTAVGLACTAVGIWVQNFLLAQIERPYRLSPALQDLSQLALLLVAYLLAALLAGTSRRKQVTWGALTLLVAAWYGIQWVVYPSKYWPSQPALALWGPLAVIVIVLVTYLAFELWDRLDARRQRRARTWLVAAGALGLVLLAIPYTRAAEIHSQTLNYAPIFTDQGDYLDFAKNARLLNFAYTGDQNRMPAYPFLQGVFYRPGMSDQAFFEQGKQINIALSLLFLGLMAFIFSRFLPGAETLLLTGLVAFSLYIFKAPYFQAEILFYFLAFVAFVGMVKLLVRPGFWLAVGTGVVLGLAYLTKASILPGLLLFAGVYILQALVAGMRAARHGGLQWRPWLCRMAYLGLVAFCFLAVIFPYIRAMKVRFGHYFYNVNTTFYVWYDDNAQAIEAEKQYHFAEAWPSGLAPDQLPGPGKYFREHSPAQVAARIAFGVRSQVENLLSPYSVSNYQLSYLVLLGLVFVLDLKHNLRLVRRWPYLVGFCVLYFVGYLIAFVWYAPVSPERRFTYGLYIPFLWAVFVGLKEMVQSQAAGGGISGMADLRRLVNAANFIIFLSLVVNIWLVLNERMFFDRFGS